MLYRVIQQRKAMLRAALSQSNWRQAGVLRLQIARLQSRRYGLVRGAAAQGKRWAIMTLARLRRAGMMPSYRRIDLPKTRYAPWYNTWPQQSYANYQKFYRPTTYYPAAYRPPQAGYHPYVKGQVGAQVPSHMSRFGIGEMSADDVEGVVEPIGMDGFGDLGMMGMDSDKIAKSAALVAMGALAFGAASKRKKDRNAATVVGIGAGLITLFAGKKAVDTAVNGFGI